MKYKVTIYFAEQAHDFIITHEKEPGDTEADIDQAITENFYSNFQMEITPLDEAETEE